MGFIKVLAKTYGNYLLTTQALKVAETIKKMKIQSLVLGNYFS